MTLKNCNVCGSQHYGDNGRFCWTVAKPNRPIKATRKELADLAARGLTVHLH